jgi:hypothetical protein
MLSCRGSSFLRRILVNRPLWIQDMCLIFLANDEGISVVSKTVTDFVESTVSFAHPVKFSSSWTSVIRSMDRLWWQLENLWSTQGTLGVDPPRHACFYTILSPVQSYFVHGEMNAVSLLADPKYVRSTYGGAGDCKLSSNYGPAMRVQVHPSFTVTR